MAEDKKALERLVLTRVMRLNAKIHGIVAGLILGTSIFIATNWLILKGGHKIRGGEYIIGPHLSLLGQFFIGYDVSFVGSLIGFAYGSVTGFALGYLVATIYNWFVELRERNDHSHDHA